MDISKEILLLNNNKNTALICIEKNALMVVKRPADMDAKRDDRTW